MHQDLPHFVSVGVHPREPLRSNAVDRNAGRRVRPCRLDDALHELNRVERLNFEVEPPRVELVREQDLIDNPAEVLRLVGDERDEAVATALVEGKVVTKEGLRGAVDCGKRRAKLVRRRGNEISLQRFQLADIGQVAEGVDRPAEDWTPEIAIQRSPLSASIE